MKIYLVTNTGFFWPRYVLHIIIHFSKKSKLLAYTGMSICSGFVTYVYQCIFHVAVIDEEATIFSIAFAIADTADTANIADTANTLGLLLHFTWIFLGFCSELMGFRGALIRALNNGILKRYF
jgi:membrane protease YdiL (CAAX protease family)